MTLHVEVDYENVAAPTILASLPSRTGPKAEALVITSAYDAWSLVPDLAAGSLLAVPPATALALAEGLRGAGDDAGRQVVFAFFGGQTMASAGEADLLRAIGPALERSAARREIVERTAAARRDVALAETAAGWPR